MADIPVSTDLVQVKILDMRAKEIIVSCHPLVLALMQRQNKEIENLRGQLSDLHARVTKLSSKGSSSS